MVRKGNRSPTKRSMKLRLHIFYLTTDKLKRHSFLNIALVEFYGEMPSVDLCGKILLTAMIRGETQRKSRSY